MRGKPSLSIASELGTQRRIALSVAALSLALGFLFRNERELYLPPAPRTEQEATAFVALVRNPDLSGRGHLRQGNHRDGRVYAVRPAGDAELDLLDEGGPIPAGTDARLFDDLSDASLGSLLPQDEAASRMRSNSPLVTGFIGLPGGLFRTSAGSSSAAAPAPSTSGDIGLDPSMPDTDPPSTATPSPTDTGDTGSSGNPTDPVDAQPTDPGSGTLPPEPGPGAVPEPETWALLIMGLGVIGGTLRRRRDRAAVTQAPSAQLLA